MTTTAPGWHRGLGWASAGLGTACLTAAAVMWMAGVGLRADAQPLEAPAASAPRAVVAPRVPPSALAPGTLVVPPAAPSGGSPLELQLAGSKPITVEPVGVAADGSVQVPDDPARAGWWVGGAAPGDLTGTTVLVGHLDSSSGGLGSFAALLDLPAGARLAVLDSAGLTHRYQVVARQQVVKSELSPSIFTTDGAPRLVLITCGGAFSRVTHHYDDNVVVTAVSVGG